MGTFSPVTLYDRGSRRPVTGRQVTVTAWPVPASVETVPAVLTTDHYGATPEFSVTGHDVVQVSAGLAAPQALVSVERMAAGVDGSAIAGSVATVADLPTSPTPGQTFVVRDEVALYTWGGSAWSDPVPVQGTATDAAITAQVATAGTSTRAAIDAAVDARTGNGERPIGRGEAFVTPQHFGATEGDLTVDSWQAFRDAVDFLAPGGTLHVQGKFFLSQPLSIGKAIRITAGTGGILPLAGNGTELHFAAGIDGIVVEQTGTHRPDGVEIGPVMIHSQSNSAGGVGVGLKILSGRVRILPGLVVQYFGSHGVQVLAGGSVGGGNANLASMSTVRSYANGGNGFHFEGVDSNAHTCVALSAVANYGWGLYNTGTANNYYLHPHFDQQGNGSPGAIYDNGNTNSYVGVYSEGAKPIELGPNSSGATIVVGQYGRPGIVDNSTGKTADIHDTLWGDARQAGLYGTGPAGSRYQTSSDVVLDTAWALQYKGDTAGSNTYAQKTVMAYYRNLDEMLFWQTVRPTGTGTVDLGKAANRWRDVHVDRHVRLGSLYLRDNAGALEVSTNGTTWKAVTLEP